MGTAGTIASTAGGIALIALAARDIFDALFHPEGRGTIARAITRAIWRVFRALRPGPRAFPVAGPVGLIAVIGVWAALLTAGWALVYWPHIEDGFRGPAAATDGDLVDALSMSLVSLTTLGFGDVTPTADWLRILVPIEALLGFGLLSASISWLLLIYPVLARRRSLAYEINLLREEDEEDTDWFDRLEPAALERIYAELTSRLVAVERDFVHFPVAYYFEEGDARFSLPAVAPYLHELAGRGADGELPERVRLRAKLLLDALDDLGDTTAKLFHGQAGESTPDRLAAYARDHMRGD